MAIIIGDIHGNVEKVKAFLAYKPDELHIALGDYLDSWSESPERQLEALQLLINSDSVLIWGNHDIHYVLPSPPFICPGFQYKEKDQYQKLINSNQNRFLAAFAADGWLLTHAGCHIRLAKYSTDVVEIANRLNKKLTEYLNHPSKPGTEGIFAIGRGRDGAARVGGIFWYDFRREDGLAPVPQIFGHCEVKEPMKIDNYIALDTTNSKTDCWLFDTVTKELVKLPLPDRRKRCFDCCNLVDYINPDGTCTDCGR